MPLARFAAADGTQLAYHDDGEGLALIALAGLTRQSGDFDFLAPHLAGLRLIRPDYRGRGASAWADWHSYNVAQEAGDVLALMDHLGLERAAILGTSRGGLVAMTLAATARDRLVGVCLNDVGPVLEPAGLAGIAAHIGRSPKADSFEAAALARAQAAVGFSGVPAHRWLDDVRNLYVETVHGLAINYDPSLRKAYLVATEAAKQAEADLWPLFDGLAGLPLGLIRGAGSDILSAETAAEMRRRRPDMHFAEVPGRGHVPWLDEPEALGVIWAWLEECGWTSR